MDYTFLASGNWYALVGQEVLPVPDSEEPEQEELPQQTIDPDFIEVSNMLLGTEPSPEPSATPTATPTVTPTENIETVINDEDTIQLIHDCAVGIMSINFTLALTLLFLFINKFFGN